MKVMKKLSAIVITAVTAVALTTCYQKDQVEPYPLFDHEEPPGADSVRQAEEADAERERVDIPGKEKCIYLTIDDSPLNGSRYIDSVVTAQRVKTNLFVVGKHIGGSGTFNRNYEIFTRNPYIEIYNHSFSHANHRYAAYYKDPQAVLEDFEKNRQDHDIHHKIARLPGRNLWQVGERTRNYGQSGATSAGLLAENGYDIYGRDVEWEYSHKDYTPKQTVDELVGQIDSICNGSRTFVHNHVVVLMHDQMFTKKNDRNDLGELIGRLKDAGYSFEHLTSYPR